MSLPFHETDYLLRQIFLAVIGTFFLVVIDDYLRTYLGQRIDNLKGWLLHLGLLLLCLLLLVHQQHLLEFGLVLLLNSVFVNAGKEEPKLNEVGLNIVSLRSDRYLNVLQDGRQLHSSLYIAGKLVILLLDKSLYQ